MNAYSQYQSALVDATVHITAVTNKALGAKNNRHSSSGGNEPSVALEISKSGSSSFSQIHKSLVSRHYSRSSKYNYVHYGRMGVKWYIDYYFRK